MGEVVGFSFRSGLNTDSKPDFYPLYFWDGKQHGYFNDQMAAVLAFRR